MVWSDPEIVKLSAQFVPVAEEVHLLYPEDAWSLERVRNRPEHHFFKRFGEQAPKSDWNHPGTKQGVYMIGPNAEFLGARFAASDAQSVRERLRLALERWEKLRAEKGYANRPIPSVPVAPPPSVAGKQAILRVSLRDLPSSADPSRGARFEDADRSRDTWLDFTRWAWNQNWTALDDPSAWITTSSDWIQVPPVAFRKMAREVLVDNVRGQAGPWEEAHVREAELRMRQVRAGVIEYQGRATLEAPWASYAPRIYGRAEVREGRLTRFELLAIGKRNGAWRFNQRERDPGPAWMGVAIALWRPSP